MVGGNGVYEKVLFPQSGNAATVTFGSSKYKAVKFHLKTNHVGISCITQFFTNSNQGGLNV